MANKSKYDWERIARDYRAGILSVREVARQQDVDHSYLLRIAKKNGWRRDLTARVKKEAAIKLVTGDVTTANAREDEIIEEKSDELVRVRQLHRSDIKKSLGIVKILQDQLISAAEHRAEIEEEIIEETGPNEITGKINQKRRISMMRAVSLPAHAAILRDLSVAQKNLIGLERQAWNLNDTFDPDAEEITEIPIVGVEPTFTARE